jgi:DDE superfamily endonuclease/Archaeal putative transposase ISC1217
MAIHPCGVESVLIALLSSLAILGPTLTRPSFTNFQVLFAGWIQTTGLHAVTETLVATDVARRRHHERFHRFFSRGSWAPDQWGKILFFAALCLVPAGAAIGLVIDDTLAPKKGAEVFGIGSHLDAVRSTRTRRVFAFGHCWVMLAILVPVPFSERRWALPVLFRLYRNKKTVAKERPSTHKKPYRKKTELGREMLDLAIGWAAGRRIELSADSAYCNDTVAQDLPESVVLLGAMRPDAVLTAPATARVGKQRSGRPRKRGETLPKPQALANDPSTPWQHLEIVLYGQSCKLLFKECVAQWFRPCGTRLLRIIIVHVERGSIGVRVFFSTDSKMSPTAILRGYANRWSIEVCFRDLKQLLGFADSSARTQNAVERTAPFVGYCYTLLVLWFVQSAYPSKAAVIPTRPWYPHKRGISFADILRTAQRLLPSADILDPCWNLDNLRKSPANPDPSTLNPVKRAV